MESNKGFGRCSGSGGIKIGDWCIQVSHSFRWKPAFHRLDGGTNISSSQTVFFRENHRLGSAVPGMGSGFQEGK